MPTTHQMLKDYPDVVLRAITELRGIDPDVAETRTQKLDLLAALLTDPASVQMAYDELVQTAPAGEQAIELLLKEGGEMAEAQFTRQYGGIRQMGVAKLDREMPWLSPESLAELLYYYGLIGRGYKGAGQAAHTIIYIPSDVLPWLPHPQNPALQEGLVVRPILPPSPARLLPADDSFLEDMGALLGFLHTEKLRLTAHGPHPEDTERFVQRLQTPFADVPDLNVRLALMLHLANRLGWLRRGDDGCVHLTRNPVRTFLEWTRAEQRRALWDAWRLSQEWNDLCRTPGLECTETGNWKNDPLQTRATLLQILAKLPPGAWYSQSEVIAAIQQTEPDFQRPTGNYDTWYIRSTTTQEFLTGFEHWDQVEGALLRFLLRGPLHWLAAVDLAEPSAGDDMHFSFSQWGSYWLEQGTPQPHDAPRHPFTVRDDFTVTVPYGTPLAERFRVERFAAWHASYPHYTYQINQRSLSRAAGEGIAADKILEFLRAHTRSVPEKVVSALQRYAGAHKAEQVTGQA